MSKSVRKTLLYIILILVAIGSFLLWEYQHKRIRKKTPRPWSVTYKHLGTLSSPRVADLNEDGVMDVVLGAGSVEFRASDSAVIALDGTDGTILWTARGRDQ